jgi:hypothetical protein
MTFLNMTFLNMTFLKIAQALVLVVVVFQAQVFAQEQKPVQKADSKPIVVRNISLFRNEVQLDFDSKSPIKVGTKFLAQTSVNHKCLLIVKKVINDLAYTDATQCPGYATLRKGQTVNISADDEVNEEVKVATPAKSEDT